MRHSLSVVCLVCLLSLVQSVSGQTRPAGPLPMAANGLPLKHLLVIGQTKGFEHDSVSDAMVAIYDLGRESGLWEATLRTDTELITKKDLGRNAKNLNYFDGLVFASTTGELDLDDSQKQDMMSFIKQDGKGFLGIHAALDTNYQWPEYGEMIGGWFDDHPWTTFNAPIVNEDPSFPAVRHFPAEFVKYDEIYQAKSWSREKVNVLLSLDPSKLDLANPRVHRRDRDFAVAWSKMHGKGRVFYSSLGHTQEAWSDPDIRKMYFEAVKWVLGMTGGSTASHPRRSPGTSKIENGTKQDGDAGADNHALRHQSYPADVVQSGTSLFQQNCAFCHGRDASGGEGGPNLTRSQLVASDEDGETIGDVIRNGRPAKGMPRFDLSQQQITALVAFIHTREAEVLSQKGGRKGVEAADLQTGNADAGKRYFNGAGGCDSCHSPTGDLAGIASRYQGLKLEQQMLYPENAKSKVTVTLPSGREIAGTLNYLDEFTVGLIDSANVYRSWPASSVKYKVDAPVSAHVALFGKYSDDDIHNLMAYLQTLR